MTLRVGQGFDFHRWDDENDCDSINSGFINSGFITLGGTPIAYHKSLASHSDGDVVLHALCDALLGAIGSGDIGQHFPDTDPRYKGVSSSFFLAEVLKLLKVQDWEIANTDITVIAESPKLSSYRATMRTHLASLLDLQENQVNIKATTMEAAGCIGRGEGIAAMAVVLLMKDKSE